VSLEIFERGLFGAAPGCEGTERVDVPTDQRCERGAAGGRRVNGGRWIIEGVLSSFAQCSASARESKVCDSR
jgi:hypothetical protein